MPMPVSRLTPIINAATATDTNNEQVVMLYYIRLISVAAASSAAAGLVISRYLFSSTFLADLAGGAASLTGMVNLSTFIYTTILLLNVTSMAATCLLGNTTHPGVFWHHLLRLTMS